MTDAPAAPRQPPAVAFVVAAVAGGPLIVNRFDQANGTGIAADLFELGYHEAGEIDLLSDLALGCRETRGSGVTVIDGGANIGTHAVLLARRMTGWGGVLAFEPQQRIYYALCGNLAINNCFNADAFRMVLGAKSGPMAIPQLDHRRPANFGGLSLKQGVAQNPGQPVLFMPERMTNCPAVAIDDLKLPRLDILKLDVEGMEADALDGARDTIARCRPIVFAEKLITPMAEIVARLPDYVMHDLKMNALGLHKDDPLLPQLKFVDTEAEADAAAPRAGGLT